GARDHARADRGLRRSRDGDGAVDAGRAAHARGPMMRSAVLCACAALFLAQAPDPQIQILSPGADAYLTGPTLLRARVTPPTAVTVLTFFVDGRQVCALTREPFECEWDAGASIAEHQVRAAATLVGGGRVVQTVRTKGVGYNEKVNVDVVQVTVTVSDNRGKFVAGLPRNAFHVFEDNKPQTVSHFAS